MKLDSLIKLVAQKIDFVYNKHKEYKSMSYIICCGDYNKEKYNMHQHKEYEIIFYSSGVGKLNIEGEIIDVTKGTIAVIPPKTKHSSISSNNLSYISIIGNTDGLIHLQSPTILKDNEKNEGFSLIQVILVNRYNEQEYLSALCLAYIHYVLRNVKIINPIEKAINTIKMQLNEQFHDSNLNATKLLCQSGYAEDYIRSHFKKIVGKTPVEFLTELRIKNAITLINIYQLAMPLTEVCNSCGFDDYIYFSRRFKKFTGLSPSEYRKSLLIDNHN